MTFNWGDYLALAEELAGKKATASQEAKLRCSISRAYYAAFCSARNHLRGKGHQIPETAEAHLRVRKILRNRRGSLSKQLESDLDRLRKDRNDADYRDQFPGALVSQVTLDLSLAARVIKGLARI